MAVLAGERFACDDWVYELNDVIFHYDVKRKERQKRILTSKTYLDPLTFGHAHSRMMNYIVAVRNKFPGVRILGNKGDFKSAYRRLHFSGKAAIQSMTQAEIDNNLFSHWVHC